MARSKRKIKSYSFLIIPDGKDATHNYNIKSWLLKALLLTLVAVFVLVVLGFSTYWKVASVALDYNRLEEENFELRSSLNRLAGIEDDLKRMRKINKKIRNSLSGYLQVDEKSSGDSTTQKELGQAVVDPAKSRVLFRSIPSMLPVDGFMTRGMQITDLRMQPHYGMDIAAPTGTPIKAAADGVVMFNDWSERSGYVLVIKHDYGFSTVYKHNQRNIVKQFEKVSRGQVIALLGGTGQISSGPHLHFEIWKEKRPVDPMLYVGMPSKIKQ